MGWFGQAETGYRLQVSLGVSPYQPLASETSGAGSGVALSCYRHVADKFCGYLEHNFGGGRGLWMVFFVSESEQSLESHKKTAITVI